MEKFIEIFKKPALKIGFVVALSALSAMLGMKYQEVKDVVCSSVTIDQNDSGK